MKVLHIGKKGNVERFSSRESLPDNLELTDLPMNLESEKYIDAAPETEHIIVDAIGLIDAELIQGMKSLKSIHSEGVAYNRIDVEAAKEHNITVCHSVGMNATAVAEQAVLLMSGVLKNIRNNDRAVREGRQIETKEAYMVNSNLKELADCSVGLVGFGNIAKATAALLRAYGVREIYYNKRTPLKKEEDERLGVKYLSIEELLALSDIVSLHLPVTEETVGIADHEFFSKMKNGSYLINTARGELVKDDDLANALKTGKIEMAGLDTLSSEPVRKDHPLLNQKEIQDKLLLSPHIGGITTSSFRRSYQMIWEDIETIRSGNIPQRTVK